MKKFLAIALAIVTASALFACGDDNSTDTKAPASTTKAPVTTKAPTADTTVKPEDTDAPETTAVPDNGTDPVSEASNVEPETVLALGSDLVDKIDAESAEVEGITPWGDGPAANLFDGDTEKTKMGGAGFDTEASVTWKTTEATTVKGYILYTGNDSGSYKGRTPLSFTLYGSNDGADWQVIDEVSASGMEDVNATPYGFTVDTPAAYTNYKLTITSITGTAGELQLNEIILVG